MLVSGGPDCLDKESGFYALLYEQALRPGEGERDSYEDAGEALSQNASDRLDLNEEKGGV